MKLAAQKVMDAMPFISCDCQGLIHYHVTDTRTLWSHMFTVMEEMKAKYFLEDYVVSDTTLELIFLAFARIQQ